MGTPGEAGANGTSRIIFDDVAAVFARVRGLEPLWSVCATAQAKRRGSRPIGEAPEIGDNTLQHGDELRDLVVGEAGHRVAVAAEQCGDGFR